MAEDQRENIIACASELMHSVGIRSVSVDDICARLGISKKTFYVYFETKDLLVDALLRRREDDLVEDVEKKTKGKTILNLVVNFQKMIRNLKDVRQIPPVLYDLQKYYPQQLHDHLQRLQTINRDILARYLRQGIEEGFFREDVDVEVTARVLAYLHQTMIDQLAKHPAHPTIVTDSKIAMDIFFRGLVSEKGKREIMEQKSK